MQKYQKYVACVLICITDSLLMAIYFRVRHHIPSYDHAPLCQAVVQDCLWGVQLVFLIIKLDDEVLHDF